MMMMMMDMIAGYVQQEDLFLPTLTVQEHLIFQVYNIIYRQATHTTVLELYTRVNVDCVQARVRMDREIPIEERILTVHTLLTRVLEFIIPILSIQSKAT